MVGAISLIGIRALPASRTTFSSQWTRKVAARTVCRWLSPDQREDYQAWIDNDRRLRDLLTRLETLGAADLDADPRWNRRPGAARDRTSQTSL